MNSKILHAALFCLAPEGFWGLPLIIWGDPGTGKTSFLKDSAKRTSMAYERLSPAERGEGQFGVVPVPHTDGFLHYPAPAWAQRFDNGGVLFLDEINTGASGPAGSHARAHAAPGARQLPVPDPYACGCCRERDDGRRRRLGSGTVTRQSLRALRVRGHDGVLTGRSRCSAASPTSTTTPTRSTPRPRRSA